MSSQSWRHLPAGPVGAPRLHTWIQASGHPTMLAARVAWYRGCADVPLTYREIGERIGRSAGRVRQLEAGAFRLLRVSVTQKRISADDLGPPGTRLRYLVLGTQEGYDGA